MQGNSFVSRKKKRQKQTHKYPRFLFWLSNVGHRIGRPAPAKRHLQLKIRTDRDQTKIKYSRIEETPNNHQLFVNK